ncbi:MAG: OB-fold domain-containing protein [Myxococcales bacterium]|nr:OB-fold domain-containing protein [Myxococcales bacterium]
MAEQVPAIEGWFTTGPEPKLLGSQCSGCKTYFFPKETTYCRNPGCQSTAFEEVELSRTGTIWSYTEHFYKPPAPYIADEPFEPYTIAAVELADEKLVVLGQMAAGVNHSDLKAGMQVELVVERAYDVEDVEHTMWKWKPLAA